VNTDDYIVAHYLKILQIRRGTSKRRIGCLNEVAY